jgi:hypothetical protein
MEEKTEGTDKNLERKEGTPTTSRVLSDGTLVELVYDPEARTTALVVWHDGQFTIEPRLQAAGGEILIPYSPRNNLISNHVVLLPSKPSEYGTEAELLAEIQAFIHQYVDLTPIFEQVAAHYVVLSWLYDAFNDMPYLRLRGDFGSGKTRALLTIGSLCNKAFFASGASTVSPIFHTLDAFGGTLIFDEADFRFSDEKAEMVKILNNGNVQGMPVLRTMMNRQREFNPQAFRVFGPKIVATRGTYDDKGLESRFLTEEMGGRALRTDIPINLPPSFKDEARHLRNKLLLYRFRRRSGTRLDPTLVDPSLEPRLNQILLPLLSVIDRADARAELRGIARNAQADLVAERGYAAEAQVLEILAERLSVGGRSSIPLGEVTTELIGRYGAEYERPITNRWVGGLLRKRLNVRTHKSHGVYVVPLIERAKVDLLCVKFGIHSVDGADPGVQSGDVGTLGTS